jgi:hypothetical protein
MNLDRLVSAIATGLLLAGFYACGGHDAKPDSDAGADPSQDAAPAEGASAEDAAGSQPTDPGPKPLTVADIDRWERGMAAELEAVHAAGEKRKAAKTGDDTVSAMMAVQDQGTLESGAKAAGVDGERYNLIRSTLSETASYLAPSVGGIDTTGLSSDQRAQMSQDNAAQLDRMKETVPPDVISALTPRAAELRKKDLELVAARLKASGMGAP